MTSYQFLRSGTILQYHLVNRFPRAIQNVGDVLRPFDQWIWAANIVCLLALTYVCLIAKAVYHASSASLGEGQKFKITDISEIVLRITFGVIEPQTLTWFPGLKTGMFDYFLYIVALTDAIHYRPPFIYNLASSITYDQYIL